MTDDASGEDASPDFFWESAAGIHEHGWTLELRIPFSSLRYKNVDPQIWSILLYRNFPRDRHYHETREVNNLVSGFRFRDFRDFRDFREFRGFRSRSY